MLRHQERVNVQKIHFLIQLKISPGICRIIAVIGFVTLVFKDVYVLYSSNLVGSAS